MTVIYCFNVLPVTQLNLDGEWSLILAMAIVGRAKHTHTRARVPVCISPAPQSPSPKSETTRSLTKPKCSKKVLFPSSHLAVVSHQNVTQQVR